MKCRQDEDEFEQLLPNVYAYYVKQNAQIRNQSQQSLILMIEYDFDWQHFDASAFFPKMNASNMQLIDKTMKLAGKTYIKHL